MLIKVKYFSLYEELKNKSEEALELSTPLTLKELFFKIMEDEPLKEQYFKATLFAINRQYAPSDSMVSDGDEVALIPPVSGG